MGCDLLILVKLPSGRANRRRLGHRRVHHRVVPGVDRVAQTKRLTRHRRRLLHQLSHHHCFTPNLAALRHRHRLTSVKILLGVRFAREIRTQASRQPPIRLDDGAPPTRNGHHPDQVRIGEITQDDLQRALVVLVQALQDVEPLDAVVVAAVRTGDYWVALGGRGLAAGLFVLFG
uniref:(northern house mosquito) hypothetical protein n=1 Tax=Culex pipiens TaxID=7175 RepID=A0A8D8DYJ6_CULPI